MAGLRLHQLLGLLVLVLQISWTEPRVGGGGRAAGKAGSALAPAASQTLARPRLGRRVLCPKITRYAESRNKGCISKYECKQKCEKKKRCRTKYEYKCTDYKRQECKNVWQNQCNGKRNNRVKRFIPTETIFDQSYPIPQSDLPFASPTAGQKFDFASPPKSRRCWQRVRECKWVKYKSTCRNEPTKVCDKKPSNVCKTSCKRVYYCNKCEDKKKPTPPPRPKPTRPTTSRPRPPPVVGAPAPPRPGQFQVRPPAPPRPSNNLDTIIDAKRARKRRP